MRVMIDACVLYPTVMREVVLGCAKAGLFEARWSARILEEWARAAGKLGPAEEVWARGEIAALGAVFPQAMVTYDAAQERQFWLPDPADIHVLTAAVVGSCDGILTMNAKDFPRNILGDEALLRWDPDGFVRLLLDEAPDQVRGVADAVLAEANRLSEQPWTMRALMKKARMPRFGKALEA
ncbi:PIN domain-containing protein [Yoonia sp. F2084L]|uniref:RSP_2648 family PIN domain-containing protein n=1 Tax=Yoonia sp. F2084L TaxID=2926419 RepID=UPI001FF14BF6|nr:PIN domain-containing protein [Yoonia sp. F2084L]MCK0094278.1 PIN domain-containing protein [Yoonia sp. F2084L]